MKVIAIIPARMSSQRLPGKPLIMVKDKPLIQYVWENTQSPLVDFKIIATDDEKILRVVEGFGGQAIMTDPSHHNGSERCAEVIASYPDYDLVLNIQGDEPMVNEEVIRNLLTPFTDYPETEVTTLKTPITQEEAEIPHTVKVVTDIRGHALYFSRSRIPFNREGIPITYYKHLGFYGFRKESLLEYVNMQPSPLENLEKLEQLRLLEAGKKIYVSEYPSDLIDINTEEDLEKFKRRLSDRPL